MKELSLLTTVLSTHVLFLYKDVFSFVFSVSQRISNIDVKKILYFEKLHVVFIAKLTNCLKGSFTLITKLFCHNFSTS